MLWHTTNQFRYRYPVPVTEVMTRLRMLPPVQHGPQQVVESRIWIDPLPRAARSWTDPFGNCVMEVEHPCLPSHLEVTAEFRTVAAPGADRGARSPIPEREIAAARRLYLPPTRLVDRSAEIESLADATLRDTRTDEELAWECMRRVYRRLHYLPGSTGISTPASAALEGKTGVCQDFAQVMLAICRTAGLPARYVSGHLEGEGQMHAWVEVLYAAAGMSEAGAPAWHPLDPTHDRAAGEGYVTVAVGRDYADVSPVSGHCYGPTPGHLSSFQHTHRAEGSAAPQGK
jgi:transglutaminase-like putative cysteine protease